MAAVPIIILNSWGLACAQTSSTGSPQPVPESASTAIQPETTSPVDRAAANVTSTVVQVYDPSIIASVAPTSGVSGTSSTSGPGQSYRSYDQLIGSAVNPNAFLPTDNITDSPALVVPSLRLNGWWDISASIATSINYDSNITRSARGQPSLDDFYEYTDAAVNFRLGTAATPVELHLTYDYNAGIFTKYTDFDTYTHNLSFQSRIGRGNVKWFPYFTGSFRSVENPAALNSGRETYDYLQEGVRGEEDIFPNLIHTYDFSHTSVSYGQRVGDDFQVWRLYQELDVKPFLRSTSARIQRPETTVTFYPWLEMKETAPKDIAGVGELNGGIGGRLTLNDQISLEARGGWGGVSSNDPSVRNGAFSGPRYDFAFDYQPISELRLRLTYDRLISFTPSTVGRDVNVADAIIEFPLTFGSHFVVVPALELYRADSNDYQNFEHAFFPEPSLQVNYQVNDHLAAYFKLQYRATDDTTFGVATDVNVLQTTLGITATF